MEVKILKLFYDLARRHGRLVIIIMAGITVFFALFIPGLTISSSYNELVSPEEPEQARFLAFLEEFGAADDLVVVLDGDPEILVSSADKFAVEIKNEKRYIRSVFYRIDLAKLLKKAPFFLPEELLEKGLEGIKEYQPLIERISGLKNFPEILELFEEGFDNQLPGIRLDPTAASEALRIPLGLFREWRRRLENPSRNGIDWFPLLENAGVFDGTPIASRGYLRSHDGRMLFLFVRPTSTSDDITFIRPFVRAVRRACDRVFERDPSLRPAVKVAFTGMPAHALTEVEAINADLVKSTTISVVLVILILIIGFRSGKKIILAIIPLGCGMIITVGLISLTIGRLNLVSSSFLAVLFGIGIDFGIYLIRRTAEEVDRGQSEEEAVRVAVIASGRSVLTGGLTTGLAFLAVGWTDFVGFSELGLTAGMGVLVVLFTTLLLLPSLLLKTGIKPRHYDLRWVLKVTAGKRERRVLVAIVLLAGAGCAFGIFAVTRLHFDFNALKLLPPGAESTVYQLRMQNESDFQMTCATIIAGDLEELKQKVEKIKALPTVSRVDSLSDLIPDHQEEKARLIAAYRPYLSGIGIRLDSEAQTVAGYRELLDSLRLRMEDVQEAAFAGGQVEILSRIEEILTEIDSIELLLASEEAGQSLDKTRKFEEALFEGLEYLSNLSEEWLNATPITEDFFSPELLDRFKSSRGNYAAYVFPTGSIWDVDFLDRFVAELKEIAPTATGFPVTHQLTSRLMVSSLLQALFYAFGIILVLLLLDFRRIIPVLLSLIPLGVGMLWVQGIMSLLGRNYDFASMPALPLLLGLGIVYGVHIVRRWMENPEITAFAATLTSGRGVAFAALTTMASLVSLIFSRHQGVASFGIVILIGIISSLIAALYVLPAVIDLIYLKDDRPRDKFK
ncbi:MAG: MMPL family transporter [Candidatus Euphemobacter frigidus]|nr:MMPL family transporter [Candidatus Euphemobacter frigidus]MDP8276038.1 MMPL family transporter [Candidatus Euphemobacter frigidus]